MGIVGSLSKLAWFAPRKAMEFTVKLPDIVSLTPFSWAGCNPHYSHSNKESTEWILSYGVLSDDQCSKLIRSNTELMAAYTLPYASPEGLRLGSDHIAILFALDELTDDQGVGDAKVTSSKFTNALTGLSEDDTSPITLFTKAFMKHFQRAPEEARGRFVMHSISYINATAREASLRANGKTQDFENYIRLRRQCSGVLPVLDITGAALGIALPAEVVEDTTFQSIVAAAVDVICLSNDIYSFQIEYSTGNDFCNGVSSPMHSYDLSPQAAVNRASEIYRERCADMISSKLALRPFDAEVDEMVRKYIWGLEQWICGYNAWQLETFRFFGDRSKEVNKTGVVKFAQRKAVRVA